MKIFDVTRSKWIVVLSMIIIFVLSVGACQPAPTPTSAPAVEVTKPLVSAETEVSVPVETEEAQPVATEAPAPTEPQTMTKDVLVIGTDVSDTRFLDPHRQFDYSPPLTVPGSV